MSSKVFLGKVLTSHILSVYPREEYCKRSEFKTVDDHYLNYLQLSPQVPLFPLA